jgi:hypothetical protein
VPTAVSGAVIGIQPLVELILMPVAVLAARRTGMMPLMVLGAACVVGANLCFALAGSAAGMFAGQILMSGVWGVFAVLGIIVAQRLLPEAVATASAVFMSSTAIAGRPRQPDRQRGRGPAGTAACIPRASSLRPDSHRRHRRYEPVPARRELILRVQSRPTSHKPAPSLDVPGSFGDRGQNRAIHCLAWLASALRSLVLMVGCRRRGR